MGMAMLDSKTAGEPKEYRDEMREALKLLVHTKLEKGIN